MRLFALIAAVALLPACHGKERPDGKLDDAKYRATLASRGVGRFQIVTATESYPPLVLDTATGCVWRISDAGNGFSKQPLTGNSSDEGCLGNMPPDQERRIMEIVKK